MSLFPDWLVPMAATLTQERFTGPEWIFERKFDGVRLLAFRDGSTIRLLSRNRLAQNVPAIAEAIAKLPVQDIILDGEMTWAPSTRDEEDARSGQAPSTRDEEAARSGQARLAYHVFDIMWLDGRDVTGLSLEARRQLLSDLPLEPPLRRVTLLEGARPWECACSEGWEGVIAKRRNSQYEHRRSPHWLKMKCEASQELVVGGFTDPQGSRVGLGALLVGYFDGDDFVFAGKLGTGFDTALLRELRAKLDALEVPTAPFTKSKGLPRLRAHWVRPEIVVQAAFIEWTVHGKLRHPRFLGLRTDKSAREVVRETP